MLIRMSSKNPFSCKPPFPPDSKPSLTRRDLLTAATVGSLLGAGSGWTAPELPVSSRELWGWVRAQQVLDSQLTYLDTGTFGPGLRSALVAEYREQESYNSDADTYRRQRFAPQAITALAERLGGMFGCDADEIALTQGASEALNIVANGLQLTAGDEIVTTTHEHASALYPWQLQAERRGISVKQVALPSPLQDSAQALGLIASAVTDRTRVIAFSHVQYTDGAVLPAADICTFARQRNILSLIDGAQACGSIEVDLHGIGCDFYAGCLHKWLNAPQGLGFLYVRSDRLDSLWPLVVDARWGWRVDDADGSSYGIVDDTAAHREHWPATWRKFGWPTRFWGPKFKALESALDFRLLLGAERIEARIRELAIYTRLRLQALSDIELLTPPQPGMWAGIVSFRPRRGAARELAERLTRNERVVVSAVEHQTSQFAAVRACLHIYNSHDDVERLLRGVQKYL